MQPFVAVIVSVKCPVPVPAVYVTVPVLLPEVIIHPPVPLTVHAYDVIRLGVMVAGSTDNVFPVIRLNGEVEGSRIDGLRLMITVLLPEAVHPFTVTASVIV